MLLCMHVACCERMRNVVMTEAAIRGYEDESPQAKGPTSGNARHLNNNSKVFKFWYYCSYAK